MTLLFVRITALISLFFATYMVSVIPVYVLKRMAKRKSQSDKSGADDQTERKPSLTSNFYVQLLMQFGGGILFAIVFVHLMPEVRDSLDRYMASNESIFKNENLAGDLEPGAKTGPIIPYVELATCAGFFAVFLVEELMHLLLNYFQRNHEHSNARQLPPTVIAKPELADQSLPDLEKCGSIYKIINGNGNGNCTDNGVSNSVFNNYGVELELNEYGLKSSSAAVTDGGDTIERMAVANVKQFKEPVLVQYCRGLVIISAFSVHSIFDGLSIGLQKTPADIWSMFFAIGTHKLLIAFVVSMELYEQSRRITLVAAHMALFSLMSPIGVLIVIVTEETSHEPDRNPVVILLTALATGTLLYIIFFEILQKDRRDSMSGLVQFAAIVAGFGVMLCITILID